MSESLISTEARKIWATSRVPFIFPRIAVGGLIAFLVSISFSGIQPVFDFIINAPLFFWITYLVISWLFGFLVDSIAQLVLEKMYFKNNPIDEEFFLMDSVGYKCLLFESVIIVASFIIILNSFNVFLELTNIKGEKFSQGAFLYVFIMFSTGVIGVISYLFLRKNAELLVERGKNFEGTNTAQIHEMFGKISNSVEELKERHDKKLANMSGAIKKINESLNGVVHIVKNIEMEFASLEDYTKDQRLTRDRLRALERHSFNQESILEGYYSTSEATDDE
jgi:hypothetical protein